MAGTSVVPPPGEVVTVKPSAGLPPAGWAQLTSAERSPPSAATSTGAAGAVPGVMRSSVVWAPTSSGTLLPTVRPAGSVPDPGRKVVTSEFCPRSSVTGVGATGRSSRLT